MLKYCRWLLFIALYSAAAIAQVEPEFRSYAIQNGLPSNATAKVIQDRQGYLWVATRDGLAEFDGVEFRTFRHDPEHTDSLPCNDVQTIFEDNKHQLWIGCAESGIGLLRDRRKGHFEHLDKQQSLAGFDTLDAYSFAQIKSGALFVGTYHQGVLRIDPETHSLTPLHKLLPDALSLQHADVLELLADSAGDLWLATVDGLWRVRGIDIPSSAVVEQVRTGDPFLALFESRSGNIWIGAGDAVFRLPAGSAASQLQEIKTGRELRFVDAFAEDRDGGIWIGSSLGLSRIAEDGSTQHIIARAAVPQSLPMGRVRDILIDHELGLWLGMANVGLAYARPDWRNFELLRHDGQDANSLPPRRLAGVTACANGSTWVVSDFGNIARIAMSGAVTRIGENRIAAEAGRTPQTILCDISNRLWIGHSKGLMQWDPLSNQRQAWDESHGMVPGVVDLLAAEANGAVWAASLGRGITQFETNGHISTWQTVEDGIGEADFEQLTVAQNGTIWLSDAKGMRFFDRQSNKFVALADGPRMRVDAFAFDRNGALWTHTLAGLDQWRIEGGRAQHVRHIGTDAGLPAAEMASLLIDGQGAIWLFGIRGLWRVALNPVEVSAIDKRVGLSSVQFGSRPSARLIEGKILDVTVEGLLRFEPGKLASITTPPDLYLAHASVKRGDRRIELDALDKDWRLRWDDRDLQVSARALSFVDPTANQYEFQLEGYDSDWVNTGSRPERDFSRIEPGAYTLHIRARNVSGVLSKSELTQNLHVALPPWRTPMAWLIYLLVLICTLWLILQAFRQRIERRHQLALAAEKQKVAEQANLAKTEFLADIGHEIRTPMTGLLGMAELLLRSGLSNDQQRWAISVQRSGEHMLRLVNDLLDLSRIEAGMLQLDQHPVNLPELIAEIRALEAPLAAARNIDFSVEVAPDVPVHVWTDGRRIKQILLNLVNNALKFTDQGEVSIRVSLAPTGEVILAISDTGPGMSEAQVAQLFERFRQTDLGQHKGGSGLGLAITERLVRLLGGVVSVSSIPGQGSEFQVTLPLIAVAPVPETDIGVTHGSESKPLQDVAILLVEDDTTIREVMTQLLIELGATVDSAAHGLEALAKFCPGQHRLALLDLDLPGIDGLNLNGLLKMKVAREGLCTVAVTARSAVDTESACKAAGFDYFLRKPVSMAMLIAVALEWRKSWS